MKPVINLTELVSMKSTLAELGGREKDVSLNISIQI